MAFGARWGRSPRRKSTSFNRCNRADRQFMTYTSRGHYLRQVTGIAQVKKHLFNLLRGAALVVIAGLVAVHAAVGLVIGIVLTWVTGISWTIIVPISMAVAVLFVFGDDDGNSDGGSTRRRKRRPVG